MVLDLDVCGKVKVVLVVLISVTKNKDILGPYVAYADFLRKKYSNYFYIDSPKQFAITVSDKDVKRRVMSMDHTDLRKDERLRQDPGAPCNKI